MARFSEAKVKHRWPISRVDTNRAFEIATQLMTVVDMDVAGLNRDCAVEVATPDPEGFITKHFFPHFWVIWRKSGETVAYVEFVEPTRSILQLAVRDPKYNLREPLRIANLAELLGRTNFPPSHRH